MFTGWWHLQGLHSQFVPCCVSPAASYTHLCNSPSSEPARIARVHCTSLVALVYYSTRQRVFICSAASVASIHPSVSTISVYTHLHPSVCVHINPCPHPFVPTSVPIRLRPPICPSVSLQTQQASRRGHWRSARPRPTPGSDPPRQPPNRKARGRAAAAAQAATAAAAAAPGRACGQTWVPLSLTRCFPVLRHLPRCASGRVQAGAAAAAAVRGSRTCPHCCGRRARRPMPSAQAMRHR